MGIVSCKSTDSYQLNQTAQGYADLLLLSLDTDSKVATQYHSASTKTMCMLNGRIDPALLSEVVEKSVP